jgi:DNA polymerase elongation subunit (family B)
MRGKMNLAELTDTELLKLYKETKDNISRNDAMQYALKIAINSAYGMLSNPYCRWYSVDMAEAITLSGQLAVKWVCKDINGFLNKVLGTTNVSYQVAGDTDSGYFTLKGIVDKLGISDKKEIVKAIETLYNKHLAKVIKDSFENLHVYMNSYQNKIRMARENIADRGIWTGKKHYVLNVLNKEGINYPEPKLKFVGLETNRSSTPMVCKDYMKKTIKLIMTMTENDVHNYISDCKKDFFKRSFSEIATPGTANNLRKYTSASNIYTKGSPMHVRGSLVYNQYLRKLGLDKLPHIKSGDKIRFCYLQLPNPVFENVISVPDDLPDDLHLNQYIDYNAQFEKTFLSPIEKILQAIGWESNKTPTLEDVFDFG